MRISVVIVTRNRVYKLKRCISSLIRNTIKPDELLIIDNNSTDMTQTEILEISKKYIRHNIKYFRETRIGISYARNKGLYKAQGDIIAFTDDDCIVKEDWIRNIISAHAEYPDAIAIGGNTFDYDSDLVGYAGHLYRQFLTLTDSITKLNNGNKNDLNSNHYMVSLSTQNISYKRKYIKHIWFSKHTAPCEAVDFSWKLVNIRSNSILYLPKIAVFHEYRHNAANFFIQNYEYGYAAMRVKKLSMRAGYFPNKYLTPYSRKIRFYLHYALCESISSKYNFFQKIYLFMLLISREAAFLLGYAVSLLTHYSNS
jgi:glycosyltransferase involved in cell wall biosynthesis